MALLLGKDSTDTSSTIVTAVLFTVARKWKQSKCPSTDEYKHVAHIHNKNLLNFKEKQNNEQNRIVNEVKPDSKRQMFLFADPNSKCFNLRLQPVMTKEARKVCKGPGVDSV